MTAAAIAVLSLGLFGALFFGFKFYGQSQLYKKDVDKIVATEVQKATAKQASKLNAEFEQKQKLPNKNYTAPATYGSISFSYPKTWSAYINDSNSSQPINGYFHPDYVPAAAATAYALRIELLNSAYAQVLQQYDSQIKTGKLKAAAYIPPKMTGAANVQPGIKLDGALSTTQSGSMVILKIRDKTLKISTLSSNYLADFNNTILPTLSFTP